MINKLRETNSKLILKYKLEHNKDELLKQHIISKLLANDNCFFEMPIETAYMLLTDLGIKKKDLEEVYLKLTEPKNN